MARTQRKEAPDHAAASSPTGEEAAARTGVPDATETPPRELPDLVIPVRQVPAHERLRYALRSWAAHLPHRRVWLVGHRPWWVEDVEHLPIPQDSERFSRMAVRAACEHPGVSDPFLLLDGDVFVMDPVEEMQVFHRGLLRDASEDCGCQASAEGAQATRDLLAGLGHPDPLSYELHRPLPVGKTAMLDTLDAVAHLDAVHVRTAYGTLARIGGEQAEDVRINHRAPRGYLGRPFLSAAPDAFTHGAVGAVIRHAFPEPSRYE